MQMRRTWKVAFIVLFMLNIIGIMLWKSRKMDKKALETDVSANIQNDISSPETVSMSNHNKEESNKAETDIFTYMDPPKAGNGSHAEEYRRFRVFVVTQGVICQDIRHFGGKGHGDPEKDHDGAWYLCLDPEVSLQRSSCIVYSIGINNEWSFDDSIAKYGCRVYAFDPTMRKEDHVRSPKIQFFNTGLSDVDSERSPGKSGKAAWKTRTLKTIIAELGHDKNLVDVLKVDIEGDEWKTLQHMLSDGTLRKYVKQFDVEFHINGHSAEKLRQQFGILMWLDRQGFKIVNMHKNMICRICYEVSYVNTNLVKLQVRS